MPLFPPPAIGQPAAATPRPSRVWATALATVLCLVAGLGSLLLARPAGFASPLYPAAGIALALVLVWGRRVLPGVVLGAVLVVVLAGNSAADPGISHTVIALLVGLGAGLQAWLGASLVQYFVRQPLVLSEPRDIALFFVLGGPCACLVNASVATAVLGTTGHLPAAQWAGNWMTWWTADTLGVLIAAPMVLTLLGQPRSEWAPRRLVVGMSLGLSVLLLVAGIAQMERLNSARVQNIFEREAAAATAALSFKLQGPLHALAGVRGVFMASSEVSRNEMRIAATPWLANVPSLQALGVNQRVEPGQVPELENSLRAEGLEGYTVYDRSDSAATRGTPPRTDNSLFPIRYIEPLAGNAGALGVNTASIPAAWAALEHSARTDRPAATQGFRLSQDSSDSTRTGVVIYHALYRGEPRTPAERMLALRGGVFVTLRVDDLWQSLVAQAPASLSLCLVDTDPATQRRRLAGPVGCELTRAPLQREQVMAFADRRWLLQVRARPQDLAGLDNLQTWPFSVVAMVSVAMLGALLLTITGRTRRIEAAVAARTAALLQQVSGREQAEAAMRESEQRFRNIFNNVSIGVVYADLDGQIRQVNPRFCELSGYGGEELLQMRLDDCSHPDDLDEDERLIRQLVQGEVPTFRRHKRFVRKNGRAVWVQITMTLLRDSDGQPRRMVGVVEDITEHLRLVEAERAREAAEAANHAKSDFLSRMSHELRTPLNAMLGFAQLLELDKRHPLAEAQRPWVAQIQQAGWHLLDMINDVLDLSRIESGNLRLQVDPLDIVQLVDTTLPLVERDAAQRGITITRELPHGSAMVMGDSTRVKQILINLLSNAVKYNTEHGRIHLASRLANGQLELAVTDTGIGMNPEQLSELFQPFNRLGRERSSLEGTGIGLVISQRLAGLMGGTLTARSVAGEGSSFILALPAVLEPDTVRMPLDDLPAAEAEYRQRRVHYVEDNETNVEVMRGILAQRPQVQLGVSFTGLDGLSAIRQQLPDVVLLDMHLPDISGLELLRHLKADPATAHIPVVSVSADALASQIDAALAAGALRYLTKPVSVAELLAVIDELLDRVETRFGATL